MTSRVELAFRSRIAHRLALEHGTFAHENDRAWEQKKSGWESQATRWRKALHKESKRSTDTFAQHFRKEYQEWPKLPVWVACELMSFGTLSRLYKSMTTQDRAAVAASFSIHHKVLASWLHMLVYVWNIAAHQGRLWNRVFSIKAAVPRDPEWRKLGVGHEINRVYGALCVLRQVSRQININDSDRWALRVVNLMLRFPSAVGEVSRLGAPEDWRQRSSLWS